MYLKIVCHHRVSSGHRTSLIAVSAMNLQESTQLDSKFLYENQSVLALAKVFDAISTASITVLISVANSFVYIFSDYVRTCTRSERSSNSLK